MFHGFFEACAGWGGSLMCGFLGGCVDWQQSFGLANSPYLPDYASRLKEGGNKMD